MTVPCWFQVVHRACAVCCVCFTAHTPASTKGCPMRVGKLCDVEYFRTDAREPRLLPQIFVGPCDERSTENTSSSARYVRFQGIGLCAISVVAPTKRPEPSREN